MFDFWNKKTATTAAILGSAASPNRQGLNKAGIIVTKGLEEAIERCRHKVQRISKDCRKYNRRFRDPEFDFLDDRDECLHGIRNSATYYPSDVLRINEIFENPKFFIGGATGSDISQGELGDCWFLSGLSSIATAGLVGKICVERDEQVGVYGFIFWRDAGWVDVIVDDLLFVKVPKWREANEDTRTLFKDDQDAYIKQARKGNKILYFAKSATENETWVPLLEKAYAKLHGDYASLEGGWPHEAIEDLSGAVSKWMHPRDILDPERFWNEELLKANQDRLFACCTSPGYIHDDGYRLTPDPLNGLVSLHAYSVVKAMEYKGIKFVKIRNPWGDYEWKGRWSDGSKEWTGEWLEGLKTLDYSFGDDGEFLMEYSDFLKTWDTIDRCRLFDENWALSQLWLQVNLGDYPRPTSFGDVSFTISLSRQTPVVLMLSQLETRYFLGIENPYEFSLSFLVFRFGEKEPIASSLHDTLWMSRSVNVELDLEAGDYVVHIKIERLPPPPPDPEKESIPTASSTAAPDSRKKVQKKTELLIGASVAANFRPSDYGVQMPLDEGLYHGIDLTTMEVAMYDLQTQFNAKKKAAFAPEDKKKDNTDGIGGDIAKGEKRMEKTSVDREDEKDKKDKDEPISSPTSKCVPQKDEANKASTEEFRNDKSGLSPPAAITKKDANEASSSQTIGTSLSLLKIGPDHYGSNTRSEIKSPSREHNDKTAEAQVNPHIESKQELSSMKMANPNPKGPESPESSGLPDGLHQGYFCSGHKGSITGSRFHCLDIACPNYNLCEDCMKKGIHDSGHQMLEVKEPDYNLIDDITALSTSDDVVTIGFKVYASKDCEVSIKGQLRHGNLIRNYVTTSRII